MTATLTPGTHAWDRYTWAAGLVFVVALVAEIVVSLGAPINQNDSAAKITSELARHRSGLVTVACLSIVYAVAFLIYLYRLHDWFAGKSTNGRLPVLVLVGGVLFVTLHAVSDVGIIGMLGAKLASYSAGHDPSVAYSLYLTTFALDSVGDVLGCLFALATGVLVLRSGGLPRWLGWTALVSGFFLFLQGFGLGGVIASFGLILDLIGFVLLLVFVATSSIVLFRAADRGSD